MGEVVIHLGSNIEPAINIRRGANLLAEKLPILRASRVWVTPAVGTRGPSFYNAAILCATNLTAEELKFDLLRPLEDQLGRIRSPDKYAARTMDMDAIILNGIVLEPNLWDMAFILLPTAEIFPGLIDPISGKSLKLLAEESKPASGAYPLPDFPLL
jgi:2-amino-4-hydroxy-6-hydroxymethyldihydropteridine diphosphokinase